MGDKTTYNPGITLQVSSFELYGLTYGHFVPANVWAQGIAFHTQSIKYLLDLFP